MCRSGTKSLSAPISHERVTVSVKRNNKEPVSQYRFFVGGGGEGEGDGGGSPPQTQGSNMYHLNEEGTLSNSFYNPSITLTLKSDKNTSRKDNYRPISLMKTDLKILNKMLPNLI